MLTVTKAASRHLCNMLERPDAPNSSAVRLLVEPEGLRMTVDCVRDGDEHFDHGGRTLLVLDPDGAAALSRRTLDVDVQSQQLVCKS